MAYPPQKLDNPYGKNPPCRVDFRMAGSLLEHAVGVRILGRSSSSSFIHRKVAIQFGRIGFAFFIAGKGQLFVRNLFAAVGAFSKNLAWENEKNLKLCLSPVVSLRVFFLPWTDHN